ncbi:hypothetical protein ZWY2020_011323 [Hordeum vulgare]|nr:hypothetical protein ZWY2020_011323 [Hordeum vulgare]
MILGAELFERMTTLGIAVNLVPYMTGTMHLGSAAAANTVTNFIGTSFMLCLLGGFCRRHLPRLLPHHRRLLRRPSHRTSIAPSATVARPAAIHMYVLTCVFRSMQGVMVLTISTVALGCGRRRAGT